MSGASQTQRPVGLLCCACVLAGTGKTTVARIYAQLLKELGALPEAEVVETSGAELVSGGTTKLKEQLKKLDKGGVLFIDEVSGATSFCSACKFSSHSSHISLLTFGTRA
jgi:Holliday junction resolvasome RuvABC ATP-dependent DNA helicase subunit